jgi:Spy/CpxP family protein refolding chaperone
MIHQQEVSMKRLIVVAMVVGLTFCAGAQPGPGSGAGRGPRPQRAELLKELNLTDQQMSQITKLRLDMEKKQVAGQSKIRMARIELRELMQVDTPDRTAIEKKLKEVSDAQHQLKLNMVDHMFAVRALLTPEQQKTWKKHMAGRLMGGGGPMRDWMERRMERYRDID